MEEAWQGLQAAGDDCEGKSLYVVAPHCVAAADPSGQYEPGGHAEGGASGSAQKEPAGHTSHVEGPLQYLGASQAVAPSLHVARRRAAAGGAGGSAAAR
jgi:hypothetical protein